MRVTIHAITKQQAYKEHFLTEYFNLFYKRSYVIVDTKFLNSISTIKPFGKTLKLRIKPLKSFLIRFTISIRIFCLFGVEIANNTVRGLSFS